jgi:hypothetical protein
MTKIKFITIIKRKKGMEFVTLMTNKNQDIWTFSPLLLKKKNQAIYQFVICTLDLMSGIFTILIFIIVLYLDSF